MSARPTRVRAHICEEGVRGARAHVARGRELAAVALHLEAACEVARLGLARLAAVVDLAVEGEREGGQLAVAVIGGVDDAELRGAVVLVGPLAVHAAVGVGQPDAELGVAAG